MDTGTAGGRYDPGLAAVVGERRALTSRAYRLLGSLADADDVVQEACLRWYRLSPGQRAEIVSPGGWLTTVASRICLDLDGGGLVSAARQPIHGGLRIVRHLMGFVGQGQPPTLQERTVNGRPGLVARRGAATSSSWWPRSRSPASGSPGSGRSATRKSSVRSGTSGNRIFGATRAKPDLAPIVACHVPGPRTVSWS